MIEVWTDGAAQPTNPGPAGAGVIGYRDDDVVFTVAQYLGEKTNNDAEYLAAIRGLMEAAWASQFGEDVVLRTDSKLVVEQFYGRWKCNTERLRKLLSNLKGLAELFDTCELVWIPREENEEADELSKLAVIHGR